MGGRFQTRMIGHLVWSLAATQPPQEEAFQSHVTSFSELSLLRALSLFPEFSPPALKHTEAGLIEHRYTCYGIVSAVSSEQEIARPCPCRRAKLQ